MEPPTAQTTGPVIRMEDVTVASMQDLSAVVAEAVDWTVNPGDFWVVAGLQGTGKSDLLMMTGGLMPPAAGHYWLFGEEMPVFEESRLALRLRLGLVFDGGQLFNHLTAWENIALPVRYHRNLTRADAATEVQPFLEAMELGPWADSTPSAIGRNWRKRVGLARALMLKPEVLLVDSPLAGLDPRHVNWWLSVLGELSKGHPLLGGRPLTLVVTTADARPWKSLARQFGVLKNRRFVVLGTWAELEAASEELLQERLPAETRAG
ncbi:MAG TPA: ATP-binding cassette domain-containing protein [Candidatus Acidoferrum sp.]|jgi:phospholipid/cholesterol/gamma-HCH transport system ATP-binding protein|nr:ATP-binding cassette domain-containing protein [Candidatus Acidoferrum sp.]